MAEQPPPRPDVEQLAAAAEQLHTAMRAYVAALAPVIATMAAALQRAARATRDDYALAPPPDRPAWQSPHGPAHTRRTKE
ncbi:hypothetical protein [Streptomyces sp. DT171]|uniref:hypothetical protein n=1 Tax=Streptomyces sp. DT171 TaxID=3416524 RepID=UPI003CE745F7